MAIPSVCGLQVRSVRDNFSPLLLRANLRTFSTTSLFQTRNHQLDTLASSGGNGVDSSGYPQNPALDLGNFPFTFGQTWIEEPLQTAFNIALTKPFRG